MPKPLTHAQLAEVARLLEATKQRSCPAYADMDERDLREWLDKHADALLAAAQRVAEAEGCVREAIEKMRAYREQYTEDAKSQTGDEKEYSLTMAGAFIQAACGIIDIAAEHNIDLSEPTKGST